MFTMRNVRTHTLLVNNCSAMDNDLHHNELNGSLLSVGSHLWPESVESIDAKYVHI